jgi:hypothetical protein
MIDRLTEAPASERPKPLPFLARVSLRFLKRVSLIVGIVCFVSAIAILGFSIFALFAGLFGWKKLDLNLISLGVLSSLLNGYFAFWCVRKSEYFKAS